MTPLLVYADVTPYIIKIGRMCPGNSGGTVGHTPAATADVELTFDNETGELTISAPGTINGCVYVYDLSGMQEAYSPELNTTVTLPRTEDVHVISLQGTNWYGEGKIVY
ncbi:MAG: hypothetical protein K2M03_08945 [Muribaculaceae bacterium]|nr:hypothetical protein [Muribaculaceae bacterium]